jgi:preprotein translocase subunit SecG
MSLLVIFLSVLLFLDCVLLICLVLLQLPKKEAGAGLAFGGAATDALFGAGSGNVLTKITKYVAGGFFGLALILAILSAHVANVNATSALIKALGAGSSGSIPLTSPGALTPPSSSTPAPAPESKPAPSSGSMPFLQLTNAPAPANAAPNK